MRGPARLASGSGDLRRVIYLPSRAWLHGLDPYDHEVLDRMWTDAGGEPDTVQSRWGAPLVYPPTTFPDSNSSGRVAMDVCATDLVRLRIWLRWECYWSEPTECRIHLQPGIIGPALEQHHSYGSDFA